MKHAKLMRKARIGMSVLKGQGPLRFAIRSLEFAERKLGSRGSVVTGSTKHKINTRAIYEEVLQADPSVPANRDWEGIKEVRPLVFNWLMPPPGKGSGGHMTLYRFINYLEQRGHTCRIYMHNPGPHSTVEAVRAVMGDAFPVLNAEMSWLKQDEAMAPADGIFATSWETAYTVYASKAKAKKFYFVQDFEPFFYPVGSFSVLAENTYRLGLRGITAGGWLSKKLHESYGMTTDPFWFGSDSQTYTLLNDGARNEIVFYARPTTERRAFEIGILTLDLFHGLHPDVVINFIGWDVSMYDIPFPHRNLGILDPTELNEVYNRCAASLVMSLTNMSLLPLELLASGCLPVVNDGENNRLVSNNEFIIYTPCDPKSLASALSHVITMDTRANHARKASESVQHASWDESGKHCVDVIEAATRAAKDK